MKVFKFGGASVKDAPAVQNVTRIINSEKGNLAVVVSAMGKTTNLLEILVKSYFEKSDKKWENFSRFKTEHLTITESLFGEK
jgi:aspartate kinase